MNLWKKAKRGLQLFLAVSFLFNGFLNANTKTEYKSKKEEVIEYVQSLPKEERKFNLCDLDLFLKNKEKENIENISSQYRGPPSLFSFGQNKLKEKINWKGKKINDKVTLFYADGLEKASEIEATITKEVIENLEKVCDFELKEDLRIFVYDPNKMRGTNLYPGRLPGEIGGFYELRKRGIVIPWKDNRHNKKILAHELSHPFLRDKIFEEQQKAWKIPFREEIYGKPFVLPQWFNEGFAENNSNGGKLSKNAEEFVRDLVLNDNLMPIFNLQDNDYLIYPCGESFCNYFENKYGKEAFATLFNNWYIYYSDINETLESEDVFGNKIKKRKGGLSWLLAPFASKERIMNHSFSSVGGKDLFQLDKKWREEKRDKHLEEAKKYDKIEDFAVNVCPEALSLHPLFNGKNFAYLTVNKARTRLEIKIISDKFDSSDKEKKARYSIKEIVEGTDEISDLKPYNGMDMNKNYLIFSARVHRKEKLFFYDLEKEMLESKEFKNIIEINDPAISQDSKFAAFVGLDEKGRYDIYVYNIEKKSLEKLTDDIYVEKDLDFGPNNEILYASDKTHDGNYDIFKIKNLDKNSIERIICNDADDIRPRFNPHGDFVFISDRKGIDNLFLHYTEEEQEKIFQLTNLITPVKDVFWSENGNKEEKVLFTYFQNLTYNVADLREMNISPIQKEDKKNETETLWRYNKEKFEDVKFKREFKIEDKVYGATQNGFYVAAYISDRLNEMHFVPGVFLDENKAEETDFFLIFTDLSEKIPYQISIEKFTYTHPDKYGKDTTITYSHEESMNTLKASIFSDYPINTNKRISNNLSIIYADKNSEEFFYGDWQKFYIYEELYPEYYKGVKIDNTISFIGDYIRYGPKGPAEGHGFKVNLRTKIDPLEKKINIFSVDGALRKYKKLGNFGVLGFNFAAGYGWGKEFEQFGAGGIRTVKGYGLNQRGSVPEWYGDGYYLFNAELSQIPLIKAFVLPFNIVLPGINGSVYFNSGNVFDEFDKIPRPKASIGVGLESYILLPVNLYTSFRFEDQEFKTQLFFGYNF